MEIVLENVQNGTNLSQGNSASASDIEQGLGRIRVIETGDGLVITHFVTARERFFSEYSKFAVKTAQSTVEMCRVVYEAKKSLQKSEYASFLKDIGRKTEDSTIRKYLAIGERYDDLIAYTNLLPASWTSMYEVIQLPAESFLAMVTLGESMANLTGAQIKRLKGVNASNNSVNSTVPTMPSTNVKRSTSIDTDETKQSVDSDSASAVVESIDALISAHTTASASSDASSRDDEDADSSSDNEFAQQATSSLLERVSQNTIATAGGSVTAEEEADGPYEVAIRFKSRPSTAATHAIIEALTSVFSEHRVEAEIMTKETEII